MLQTKYLLSNILYFLQTSFTLQLCQFSQGWVFIYEGKPNEFNDVVIYSMCAMWWFIDINS